jgi:TfoX/Sxy family transcriptional regulator of competence genes
MAYDEILAARVRDALAGRETIVERQMFGGLGFLYHGNMCTGVRGDALIVRLGDRADEALEQPHVRPFSSDNGARTMTGWALVDPPGIATDEQLETWVDRSVAFTGTLPPK